MNEFSSEISEEPIRTVESDGNPDGSVGSGQGMTPQGRDRFPYPAPAPIEAGAEDPAPDTDPPRGVAYLLLFSLAGAVVAFDQFTKWLVRDNVDFGHAWNFFPELRPYFRIVHWKNTGAAFGLFQDSNLFFTVLAIIVAAAIIYYYPQISAGDWFLRFALGLQLGGALGNLIDRIAHQAVTDFISILNFPVFNVADASISVGTVFLVIGMWRMEEEAKRIKKAGLEAEERIASAAPEFAGHSPIGEEPALDPPLPAPSSPSVEADKPVQPDALSSEFPGQGEEGPHA